MADQIPLFQRRETGPRRAGGVKPPLELARGEGLAQAGQALATFSGSVFEGLVKTQAANELAEAKGQVSTLIESFSTFTASKPNAGFDELQSEWDRISSLIKTIPGTLKTGQANQEFTNWLDLRQGAINQQAHGKMYAIKFKQQAARFQSTRELNMANHDIPALEKQYEDMVITGAFDNKVLEDQLELDIAVIKESAQKLAADNASAVGLAAWEASKAEFGPLGSKKAGFAAIQALEGLSGDDKALAESKLNVQVDNRRAENKIKAEEAAAQSVEQINKRLNERNFTGIIPFINSLPLTETQKNEQILKATSFTKAVNDTKEGIVTSDETNIAIDRNLNRVRKGEITYDEGLAAYSELAKNVNIKEGEQNLDDIRTAADAAIDPVLKRPVVVDGQASVDRIRAVRVGFVRADNTLDDTERSVLIAEIERQVLADKTELVQWARENADKPNFNQEFQKQVNAINRPKVETVTLTFFDSLMGTGRNVLARKRMESLEENAPGIFNTLTEEEKASILERFRRGATVQEIIDLAK